MDFTKRSAGFNGIAKYKYWTKLATGVEHSSSKSISRRSGGAF